MAKIGDRVTVEIQGAPVGGTLISGAIKVGPGASIKVPGKIVEDYAEYWLVELSINVGGKNRILVPKSARG